MSSAMFNTSLGNRQFVMNRHGCAWIEADPPEGYWSPGTHSVR